jgi:hypothetical protein
VSQESIVSEQNRVAAEAHALGQLLIEQSPYGTPDYVTDEAEIDGPARAHLNQPGKRLNASDLEKLRSNPQTGVWWYFDGKPRYVAKAVRVAYTYTLEGEDQPRTDYFLIGYEGAGW